VVALLIPFNLYANILSSSESSAESEYNSKNYPDALKHYLNAQIEDPSNINLKYNLANSYYKNKQFQEAEQLYMSIAQQADPPLNEKAFYNLGNTFYRAGKLQEAIASYEQALKLDPKDEDAKFNLEFVRNEIKKRMENQKQRQEQQQTQQNQKQDQSQDQKKDSKDQKEQQQQQAKAQPQASPTPGKDKKDEKNQAAGTPDKKQKMSKEDAERLLSSMKEERNKFNKNDKKVKVPRNYDVEKDW
jgi:tetratricopeptide (TPR) repeat protein